MALPSCGNVSVQQISEHDMKKTEQTGDPQKQFEPPGVFMLMIRSRMRII